MSASKLFAEKGFAAVSTREIAEHAEVNLAAIAYHFGGKANLFMECVRFVMDEAGKRLQEIMSRPTPRTPFEAAVALCELIRTFMQHLVNGDEPQGCQMLCREILTHDPAQQEARQELTESFVQVFMRPLNTKVRDLLELLSPDLNVAERSLTSGSILGQCLLYATHQPFIETMDDICVSDAETRLRIEEHICAFSMRALHLPSDFVTSAIAATRPLPHSEQLVADDSLTIRPPRHKV